MLVAVVLIEAAEVSGLQMIVFNGVKVSLLTRERC